MSLILDALRKADAERERGSVPNLHAQPVVPRSGETSPPPRARSVWPGVAFGIALGLAGALVWMTIGRDAPPVPSGAPQEAAPVAPAPAVPAAADRAPPVAAAPGGGASTTAAAPPAEPAPWPQPEERRPAPDAANADAAKADAPVRVLGNVPPAPPPVIAREQLPPNIRSELPQLTIGGSIYSPEPAARSLIINGQLFRERDRLTQELSLEEIRLKAAVFSFRGYRFEVLF